MLFRCIVWSAHIYIYISGVGRCKKVGGGGGGGHTYTYIYVASVKNQYKQDVIEYMVIFLMVF